MTKELIGREITRRELQARWAYSELASSRFAAKWYGGAPQPLSGKAQKKIPFEQLSSEELECLAALNASVRGPLWARITVGSFVCTEWTREQLLQIVSVVENPWPPLADYIATTPPHGDMSDPRNIASSTPPSQPFSQQEPIIVVPCYGKETLFDGTLRSILFLRSSDADARILVWVPAATIAE
jgi:hypothetical protein